MLWERPRLSRDGEQVRHRGYTRAWLPAEIHVTPGVSLHNHITWARCVGLTDEGRLEVELSEPYQSSSS